MVSPLLITSSTPPTSSPFSALTNPFTQLSGTNPPDTIAGNTSITETVQFAPTTTGPVTGQWLLQGNDGNGVQTVVLTGTGVAPPPPSASPPASPPASAPVTTTTTPAPPPTTSTPKPPALTIASRSGHVRRWLTLRTTGDPHGGALTYTVRDGSAKGCRLAGARLRSTTPGTCIVTAKRSARGLVPDRRVETHDRHVRKLSRRDVAVTRVNVGVSVPAVSTGHPDRLPRPLSHDRGSGITRVQGDWRMPR